MTQLLKDSELKIIRFIEEALISLDHECGFPAMLTILSVILAISESIFPSDRKIPDKELMSFFITKMDDKSWLTKNENVETTDEELSDILIRTRDGLAHQISLPLGVILVEDLSLIYDSNIEDYDYIIAVRELIYSVRQTIYNIINDEEYSTKSIDGKFSELYPPRGVAGQVRIVRSSGTITSGSAAGN